MSCMEVAHMILDAVLPAVLLINNKSQMNVFACFQSLGSGLILGAEQWFCYSQNKLFNRSKCSCAREYIE